MTVVNKDQETRKSSRVLYKDKACHACGCAMIGVYVNRRFCDECNRKRRNEVSRKQKKNPGQPERIKAYRRKYYLEHMEKENEAHRAWLAENAEQQREYRKNRYWSDGGEAARAYARQLYAKHTELYREISRRYTARHHADVLKRLRERYWADPEKRRLIQRLRRAAAKGNAKAKWELARILGKLQHCSHLHLTALTLPCGTLEICHGCSRCPKTGVRIKSAWSRGMSWAG